jgi:hypothetical protein
MADRPLALIDRQIERLTQRQRRHLVALLTTAPWRPTSTAEWNCAYALEREAFVCASHVHRRAVYSLTESGRAVAIALREATGT